MFSSSRNDAPEAMQIKAALISLGKRILFMRLTTKQAVGVFFSLVFLLTACGHSAQPIHGLWDVPIQTSTPHPPTKTPRPTATPEQAPSILITPTSGKTNEDATFFLTVIVEDRYGYLKEAMVTISWEDGREPITFGPTFDIKIPIQASSSPFLLTVEKEGYLPVNQPFSVSLSEDMQYEFSAVLLPIEDMAEGERLMEPVCQIASEEI